VAVQAVAAQAEAAAVQLEEVAGAVQLEAVAGAVVQGAAGPLQPEEAEEAVAGLWAAAAVGGLRLAVRAEAGAAVVGLQLAARPDAGRLAWADDTVERQAAPLSDAAVAMEIGGTDGAISTAARS
jgi:hypothetical protein